MYTLVTGASLTASDVSFSQSTVVVEDSLRVTLPAHSALEVKLERY